MSPYNQERKQMFNKIRWLILFRLLLTTIFFSAGHLIFEIENAVFYILIAFVYFASVCYSFWLVKKRHLRLLAIVQLGIDVLLEVIVVLHTGGIESVFTVLFVLTIISSALVLSVGFFSSIVVSICVLYAGAILLLRFKVLTPLLPTIQYEYAIERLYYTLYVHIVTFVIIAFLMYSLLRRMSQIEHKLRMKEQLAVIGGVASEMAHELRNPLTSISGGVELLNEHLQDALNPDDAKIMNAIVYESDRISEILNEFLDYTKLSSYVFEQHDIVGLLNSVLVLYEQNVRDRGAITINYERAEPCMVVCDPDKLRQVFVNIIDNACEAMGSTGTLTVRSRSANTVVKISFKDTGKGIRPQDVKKIFEPHVSHKLRGRGLGLSIAKRIILMHDGRIDVIPHEVGAEFVIELPLAK